MNIWEERRLSTEKREKDIRSEYQRDHARLGDCN